MKFLSQNRNLFRRLLRVLGIGLIPDDSLSIEPTYTANSPDFYSDFQCSAQIIGAAGSTTLGNILDTSKEVFVTSVLISGTAKAVSGWEVIGKINGADVLLAFISGADVVGAAGAQTMNVVFPVPKKIDLITNNISLVGIGTTELAACAVHGYQL